jgi:uncharacterized protein (DUF58 family)
MNEPLLLYRLLWQTGSVYPGAHPGQMIGAGHLFKRHEPLIASLDPRRIDLRATVLDPFSGYRVRVYQQLSAVNVYLIADLSASMSHGSKKPALIRFLLTAAGSAFSYGDSFGFIGCAENVIRQWLIPSCQQLGPVTALAEQLRASRFSGTAEGLRQASAYLPSSRSLVFLLSDCHFSLQQLREVLAMLQPHDVIPLVLWDQEEYTGLPGWGLVSFLDMENQTRRTLLMRPALRQKIIDSYRRRQHELQRCFRAFGAEPLFISENYTTRSINCYLQQRTA